MTRKFAALCLVLAGTWSAGCGTGAPSQLPEPGTDFYAVAPETVTEVLLSSGDYKLFAFRWQAADAFQIVVASPSGPVQQCAAGSHFEEWLKALSRLPVVREATDEFSPGPEWSDVRIRDTTRLEPIEARIRLPRSQTEPVVIAVEDREFVVDVNAAPLQLARAGCGELGR